MSTNILWLSFKGTFSAGRNAEKRAARRREKLIRQADVNVYLSSALYQATRDNPKRIKSRLTVDMLAMRRMRQRRQVSPL